MNQWDLDNPVAWALSSIVAFPGIGFIAKAQLIDDTLSSALASLNRSTANTLSGSIRDLSILLDMACAENDLSESIGIAELTRLACLPESEPSDDRRAKAIQLQTMLLAEDNVKRLEQSWVMGNYRAASLLGTIGATSFANCAQKYLGRLTAYQRELVYDVEEYCNIDQLQLRPTWVRVATAMGDLRTPAAYQVLHTLLEYANAHVCHAARAAFVTDQRSQVHA